MWKNVVFHSKTLKYVEKTLFYWKTLKYVGNVVFHWKTLKYVEKPCFSLKNAKVCGETSLSLKNAKVRGKWLFLHVITLKDVYGQPVFHWKSVQYMKSLTFHGTESLTVVCFQRLTAPYIGWNRRRLHVFLIRPYEAHLRPQALGCIWAD